MPSFRNGGIEKNVQRDTTKRWQRQDKTPLFGDSRACVLSPSPVVCRVWQKWTLEMTFQMGQMVFLFYWILG